MDWFRRASQFRSPAEQADDRVGDLLLQLHAQYEFMESRGWHFRPAARLAREALKSIHWLEHGVGAERRP
jgi:hypothetical protein